MAQTRKMVVINKTWATLVSIAVFAVVLFAFAGCGAEQTVDRPSDYEPAPQTERPSVIQAAPPKDGTTLYLSQAQFVREEDPETGELQVKPGPARLGIWTYQDGVWTEEVLEDPDSNVFHKAEWFTPVEGEPGILTIGAQAAYLKIWRKNTDGEWEGESLWNPTFGGTFDRLRNFEVADVTNDGNDEICVATHDMGVVAVVRWQEGRYAVEEMAQKPETFVHEMTVADVTGNGYMELFTTPSMPNKMDGTKQSGEIDMFAFDGETWTQSIVDALETRHAKEILAARLTGEERPVLFAALEGEHIGGDAAGDTTRIRMYRFSDGDIKKTDIANLPGQLCRFLNVGDTDGDGRVELIASTSRDGIWRLDPPETPDGEWRRTLVATGTSGFEHATQLADLNGDGLDEILVASDNQRELRRYTWNGRGYSVEVLGRLQDDTITWKVTSRIP
jgi:hypothetical protein